MEYRCLGNTDIRISVVGLGCWPIAGITSPGVDDQNSVATIRACFDLGINHLDTAYAYGRSGESEERIARALGPRRHEMVIATKVGLHWAADGSLVRDASRVALRRHTDESLRRLSTDYLDLLYLHAPDPKIPVAESAGALKELMAEGKTRGVGVSNATQTQLEEFAAICPIVACQPLYNMLQRQVEADILPWCRAHGVAVLAYEPLAKGLLTGKFRKDHVFAETDWRRDSPLFQGEAWSCSLAMVERLRPIALDLACSLPQLVVRWTIEQPAITAVLCGAKTPNQIAETAASTGWEFSPEARHRIEQVLVGETSIDPGMLGESSVHG